MNRRNFIRSGVAATGVALGVGGASARSFKNPDHFRNILRSKDDYIKLGGLRFIGEEESPEWHEGISFTMTNHTNTLPEIARIDIKLFNGNGNRINSHYEFRGLRELNDKGDTERFYITYEGNELEYAHITVDVLWNWGKPLVDFEHDSESARSDGAVRRTST